MIKCPLGWGQFAKITDFAFEWHSPDKNMVYLQPSWTTYAHDRNTGFCNVNYCFPHKVQLFHPTQVSKLVLAVFLYILHFSICTATCSVGFLPNTTVMNVVDEGIASVSWCQEPWPLFLLTNKFMCLSQAGMVLSHIDVHLHLWKPVPLACAFLVQSQLSSPVNSEWAQGRATNSVPWDSSGPQQF